MNYTIDDVGNLYTGSGDALRAAILDALNRLAAAQFKSLEQARAWCLQYVRQEVSRRKTVIFSQASNYDQVELMEMLAEARDYRITGNTSAGRYPLAQALNVARGVTMVSVLTAWGNAFASAFSQLAALVHQKEQAETAIEGATTMAALGDVMATILEALV